MSPKLHNSVYGKHSKTQILRNFRFLKVVMVLGYPKYILGKFGIFLKNFYFFFNFFTTPWTFSARIWIFFDPKMSPKSTKLVYGKRWKTKFWENFGFWGVWWVWDAENVFWGSLEYILKHFEICFIFSPLLGHFLEGFWNFQAKTELKMV